MNLAETSRLLMYAASVDNRRFDDATVIVWQGILGDLHHDECQEAVRRHFARSTDYLLPAHIRQGVLELRDSQRPSHEVRALPSRFEADDERVARVKRGIALCAEALSLPRQRRAAAMAPCEEDLDPSERLRWRAIERARRERRLTPTSEDR